MLPPPVPSSLLKKQLGSLQTRAVRAAEAARNTAYKLHPTELDDLGLEAALRLYCAQFSHQEGIAVDSHSQDLPAAFNRETAYCLYKVAQESRGASSYYCQERECHVGGIGGNTVGQDHFRDLGERCARNFIGDR